MFKSPKKEDPQNNYKYIHMKNINMANKKLSQNAHDKNMEYFPTRPVKRQSGTTNLDNSKSSANIRESSETSRYSKRQSNFSNGVQEQNRSILKENEKLKKEIKRLEKMILEKEDNVSNAKHLQLELVETYRVINYYEGKIKELEKICKQYQRQFQNQDGKKSKSSKITALLQDLRTSNSELRGKNQQKQMEVEIVTTELRKMQSKFHTSQQKIIQLNKRITDARLTTSRPKFMDDYEHKNLNYQSQPQKEYFVKRRPQLSRSKKILKTASKAQSDSDASGASSQYKSSVYIKRKDGIASKPKEDSLRNSKNKYLSLGNGNLSSKLTMIENQVEALKKQNEKLHEQLDSKVKEVMQLKQEKQGQNTKPNTFQQQNEKSGSQRQLKTVTISKSKLKEIENPTLSTNSTPKTIQSSNLSKFVSNISMKSQSSKEIPQSSLNNDRQTGSRLSSFQKQGKKKAGYTFTEIKDRTLRLLTMNVARQDISYFKLIQNIVNAWTSSNPNSLIEMLQDTPYHLSSAQTSQFMFEYKNIMKFISGKEKESAHKDMNEVQYKKYVADQIKAILKDNIAYFKNITIRRDFTLNIQLSNKFKNYEQQLEQIMKRYGNKLPYSEWERIFIDKWGLTAEEGLFLQIKNYQQYKDIDYIHIADLGRYFLLE